MRGAANGMREREEELYKNTKIVVTKVQLDGRIKEWRERERKKNIYNREIIMKSSEKG